MLKKSEFLNGCEYSETGRVTVGGKSFYIWIRIIKNNTDDYYLVKFVANGIVVEESCPKGYKNAVNRYKEMKRKFRMFFPR